MRTLLIAVILFTSCQVQDNRPVPRPIIEKATNSGTPKEITDYQPAPLKSLLIEENKDIHKSQGKKPLKTSDPVSAPLIEKSYIDKSAAPDPATPADPASESIGGASYEEGYIPFIKQYW